MLMKFWCCDTKLLCCSLLSFFVAHHTVFKYCLSYMYWAQAISRINCWRSNFCVF